MEFSSVSELVTESRSSGQMKVRIEVSAVESAKNANIEMKILFSYFHHWYKGY